MCSAPPPLHSRLTCEPVSSGSMKFAGRSGQNPHGLLEMLLCLYTAGRRKDGPWLEEPTWLSEMQLNLPPGWMLLLEFQPGWHLSSPNIGIQNNAFLSPMATLGNTSAKNYEINSVSHIHTLKNLYNFIVGWKWHCIFKEKSVTDFKLRCIS